MKKHTWVEFASLASNISQNVQLQQIVDRLDMGLSLSAAAAQDEAEQKRRRDWLWNLKSSLANILDSDNGPAPKAYLLMRLLKQAESGDASLFDAWEDKERFAEVQRGARQALKCVTDDLGAERVAVVREVFSVGTEELPALKDHINLEIVLEDQTRQQERLRSALEDADAQIRAGETAQPRGYGDRNVISAFCGGLGRSLKKMARVSQVKARRSQLAAQVESLARDAGAKTRERIIAVGMAAVRYGI